MARTSIATDNFNRAGPALGANWTELNALNAGSPSIVASTVMQGGSAGHIAACRWDGAGTFSNDQYSSIVALDLTFSSANYAQGVICRASADTHTARDYYFFVVLSNQVGALGKIVNGTETILHSDSVSFANGSRIELECEGTTIRAMKDGVALGGSWTVTDASLSTGKPGIAPVGGDEVCTADDWEGGDITAGSASIAPLLVNLFKRRRG